MAYRPRLERQFDGSANQSYDCGRAVTVMLVDFGSKGLIRPTTEQIGRRMGRPTGPSNSGNQQTAVHSYDKEALRRGIKPLRYVRKRAADFSNMKEVLRKGAMVSVDTDYSVFQSFDNGRYACSLSYRGLHSVAAVGFWKNKTGTLMTKLYDPLADGRYPGCWNGPRNAPLGLLRRASGKVWGNGKWGGGIVRYAPKLKWPYPQPPEIGDAEELQDALSQERERVARLEAALAEAREGVDSLVNIITEFADNIELDPDDIYDAIDDGLSPNTGMQDVEPEPNGTEPLVELAPEVEPEVEADDAGPTP